MTECSFPRVTATSSEPPGGSDGQCAHHLRGCRRSLSRRKRDGISLHAMRHARRVTRGCTDITSAPIDRNRSQFQPQCPVVGRFG